VWRSQGLTKILIFAHGLFKLKNEASFPHHEPEKAIQDIKDTGEKHCNQLSELLISDSVSQLFSLNILIE
jgi:hypothetical protein